MTRAELAELEAAGVLTGNEAAAVWLHDVKGLSYRQIALAEDRAWTTVRDRVKRARQKIASYERSRAA